MPVAQQVVDPTYSIVRGLVFVLLRRCMQSSHKRSPATIEALRRWDLGTYLKCEISHFKRSFLRGASDVYTEDPLGQSSSSSGGGGGSAFDKTKSSRFVCFVCSLRVEHAYCGLAGWYHAKGETPHRSDRHIIALCWESLGWLADKDELQWRASCSQERHVVKNS